MNTKNRSFSISLNIINKYNITCFSKDLGEAIEFLKYLNFLFSPEKNMLFDTQPSKHISKSVRLSDNEYHKIERVAKHYQVSCSDVVNRILELKKYLEKNQLDIKSFEKLNERIGTPSTSNKPKRIKGKLTSTKSEKVRLRLHQNNNGTTILTSSDLYVAIEHIPYQISENATYINQAKEKFNQKYCTSRNEILETRITFAQKSKLENLKSQMRRILNVPSVSMADVLKYCVIYCAEHNKKSKQLRKKPVAFTVPGSKVHACFDDVLEKALSQLSEKTIIIEVCLGSCGVLPMWYSNHVKAFILNEIDEERQALIRMIQSDPQKLVDESENIKNFWHLFLHNNVYSVMCSDINLEWIYRYLKIFEFMPEAITLLKYCVNSQHLSKMSLAKYLGYFQKRCSYIEKLRDCIYNATLTGYDLLDLIKRYQNNPNVLFIVDPPYYLTSDCYDSEYPDMKFHKELSKLLHKIKGKFILFFRINASRANNSKNNELLDRILFDFYSSEYAQSDLYIYCQDYAHDQLMINFRNNGTFEAVLSNYTYPGCQNAHDVFDKYKKLYL